MNEKIFSKYDVFHIVVDVLVNISHAMLAVGIDKKVCMMFLDSNTRTANGTLLRQYSFSEDDIKTLAADGLLGMHKFTADDKEN